MKKLFILTGVAALVGAMAWLAPTQAQEIVSTAVNAADQGVTGKKLLLKSNPKMVLLSKDALVVPGANGSSADPRCAPDGSGLGGSVKLDDGTNSVTLSMPCANWNANGSDSLYKYKDSSGVPKTAKLKAGLLKVGSPAGMGGFSVPNGAATVNVEVTVGTDKYCMSFTGTGDGSKFVVKDASAGSCLPPATATETVTATPTLTPTVTPTLTTQTCGNDVREGAEECDGSDSNGCSSIICASNCTCVESSSDPVCCKFSAAGGFCGGSDAGNCVLFGGVPVTGGMVCDASLTCSPGPGTPGPCCEWSMPTACEMGWSQVQCQNAGIPGGTYSGNAVCMPSGSCQ